MAAKSTKVFTRNITLVKLSALFLKNKDKIQNMTLEEIEEWVKKQPDFDFGGKDSMNTQGIKTTLNTLEIKAKGQRRSDGDRRDRIRIAAGVMIRLAQKMEKTVGAEPGTILTDEDKTLLESL